MSGSENRNDCQEVVGEVGDGGVGTERLKRSKNGSEACEERLEELVPKADDPVAVGDHNLFDMSSEQEVQKGLQPPASKVEPGADITNRLVIGTRVLEASNLSFKVCSLLGGRHPGVDEPPTPGGRGIPIVACNVVGDKVL